MSDDSYEAQIRWFSPPRREEFCVIRVLDLPVYADQKINVHAVTAEYYSSGIIFRLAVRLRSVPDHDQQGDIISQVSEYHSNISERGPQLHIRVVGDTTASESLTHPEGHQGGGDFWDLGFWFPTISSFEIAKAEFSWLGIDIPPSVFYTLTSDEVQLNQAAVRKVWKT